MQLFKLFTFIVHVQSLNLAPPLWSWGYDITSIYNDSIPQPRLASTDSTNACDSWSSENNIGFVCPHQMMFSTDMYLASGYDGLSEDFFYAVAGGSTDADCGRCYQVRPLDPEIAWNVSLKDRQLVIQVINAGFDVPSDHFDILMSAGGFGVHTACNIDCRSKHCSAGPCKMSMFNGTFESWNPINRDAPCNSGGINMVKNDNRDEIWKVCSSLTDQTNSYKNNVLKQSCFYSNTLLYHQNFISADTLVIRCPDGLSRLTGLRRDDEDNLPLAHKYNTLNRKCRGDRSSHSYCITTYCDCCKPSCAWHKKGFPDPTWSKVDTCTHDGVISDYLPKNNI